MFSTALVPGEIFFLGSFFLLKSPRWLLMNDREDEAKSLLVATLGKMKLHSRLKRLKKYY